MKQPGDPVTLRRIWWDAQEPVTGDVIKTRTGRMYAILEVRENQLDCVVMSPDEIPTGTVFAWEWSGRK